MKNILTKFKINNYTYFFALICMLCGYIKNITIIFTICLFHELGHIFFIKLFKYNIISVELLPFGGYTTIDQKINSNINKDLLIAMGGFIFQILLFIIIYLLKNKINIITYNLFQSYNVTLILFNLIPIIPLDGSRIMHLLLEKLFSYHLSYYLNFFISIIVLILFLICNYLFHIDNYFIITFLLYKTIMYYKNYKYLEKRFLLERYLYPFSYKKIDNNTKELTDLKKNVLHYFKENDIYINEKKKIEESIYNY